MLFCVVMVAVGAVSGNVAALRQYVRAALTMEDELAWHVRSVLAPTTASRVLVAALLRYNAANEAVDQSVQRIADRLAVADAGGLLADNVGWFTLAAGATKRVLSAAEAQGAFSNVMADLYRPGSHLPGGSAGALEWEVRNHVRFLSETGHYRKVESAADALRRVLRSDALQGDDLVRATEELRRLERAKAVADEAAASLGKTPAQMMKDFARITPAPAASSGGGLLAALAGAARAAAGIFITPLVVVFPRELEDVRQDRARDLLA